MGDGLGERFEFRKSVPPYFFGSVVKPLLLRNPCRKGLGDSYPEFFGSGRTSSAEGMRAAAVEREPSVEFSEFGFHLGVLVRV